MKVGDKIIIKDETYFNDYLKSSGLLCVEADTIRGMREFLNKEATILSIYKYGYYILDVDNGQYYWSEYDFQ